MKLTVTRTILGKYSGRDHNGDLYFTDNEEVEVEYEYTVEEFVEFLLDYKDEYLEEVITSLIENPSSLEEVVKEEYAYKFTYWLDKVREE